MVAELTKAVVKFIKIEHMAGDMPLVDGSKAAKATLDKIELGKKFGV